MKEVYDFVDKNSEFLLNEFKDFVRRPGISTENTGIDETVTWLTAKLKENGVEDVQVFRTARHPIILGRAGKSAKRTLLVYGHYDVQPPGDLQSWTVDPFAAETVGDRIVGRGSCDMKNNLMACVHAVRAILQTRKQLPANLIFLFEGEEEIGSPSLKPFVEEHKQELSVCDSIICAEGGENKAGQSVLLYGVKGLLYVEFIVRSPTGVEIHSQSAGIVENPAWRLLYALMSLKDGEKAAIPHFYDGVKDPGLSEKMKYGLANVVVKKEQVEEAFDLKIKKTMSVSDVVTESYYRPTLNIDGLWSGYMVEKGMKTIVPDKAGAKVDMRLVPGQDPDVIFQNLKTHLASHGFTDVSVEKIATLPAYRLDPGERIAKAIAEAVKKVIGKNTMMMPVAPGSGAMVWLPIILGKPMGFAGSGANYMGHRPNEFITPEQYLKGVKLFATIYSEFG